MAVVLADGRTMTGPGAKREPRPLVASLQALAAEVGELQDRLRDFELAPPDHLVAELVPAIGRVNGLAAEAFERILAHYEGRSTRGIDVADVAFFALHELRSRAERFAAGGAGRAPLLLVADCGSILRHLKRALAAGERSICRVEGLAPTLGLEQEQNLALEVRTAYARFRHEVEALHTRYLPDEGDAGSALAGAASSIATLTERDIFYKLRLGDRIHLLGLQERILAWRAAASPDAVEARRLWQDLYGFTQLLQEVNRRQELLEHDLTVLERIDGIVAQAATIDAVRGSIFVLAMTLLGRDEGLDALLAGDPAAGELLDALHRIRRRLPGHGGRVACAAEMVIDSV